MPLATTVTARDGNNAAAPFSVVQDLAANNASCVSLDSGRQTYRASSLFTPFATAPVTYLSIIGSATKTVRVQRIGLWMVATANASVGLCLTRGTALGTGGTAVSPTIQKHDTNTAAATAVVKHYTTAAQSAATGSSTSSCLSSINLTGNLVAETVQIFAPSAYSMLFPEGGQFGQCLVLRGTSDILEVQMQLGQSGGANGPPAMQMGYFVEFVEDAS